MNQFRVMAAFAMAGLIATVPAAAQGNSGTHGGGTTLTDGRPATVGAVNRGKSGDTTHGRSGDPTHGTTSDAKGKSGDHGRGASSDLTSTATGTGNSPIATKISRNPQQLARLTAMLPPGMTLDQAAAGFRNQGQFIAALNASKNQGIAFADLQKAMTVDGLSLGQAVRQLRPQPPPTTTSTTTEGTPKS
jgi:hypothetical protein